MRKVLVTGATGFTGSHVVPRLVEDGYKVSCLVRPSSNRTSLNTSKLTFIEGNVDEPLTVHSALQGQDVFINIAPLVGPRDEQGNRAAGLVSACHAANVNRAIFVSSTAIFTSIPAHSKLEKSAAEARVFNSGLEYTILRPTMIYGTARDRNVIRLIRFLRKSPIAVVPGSGQSRQQPIYVEDLAKAIVDCLQVKATYGKAYNLSGAHPITFNEVVNQTCQALGVRRLTIHLPVGPALWIARLMRKFNIKSWIKEERILRLNEDRCFDHSDALHDFGFSPRSFAIGVREAVALDSQRGRDFGREPSLLAN